MEKTLKEKTTSALIWSFIDKFGQQIIYLAAGIVLGRILSPDDYGLVGSLIFFTALSSVLVGSGFSRALMNRSEIRQEEYNTVFFYNIGMGLCMYVILYFCAPLISLYFKQPLLTPLARVLFLSIIFNSTFAIQDIVFTRKMDLKTLARANFFALLPASVCAMLAAIYGFGVWALVIQPLLLAFFKMIFYWLYSTWRPTTHLKRAFLKELFPFSSRVMFTNLIMTIFNNIYFLLIGRMYNITQLGFYTQANKYQEIPTGLISNTFRSVSVPLLSGINDDEERLRRVLSKLIKTISLICFPVLLGMILIAKPLFIVLITDKWLPSVPIFQVLCFSSIFFIISYVLQESILAKGHSGEILIVEILKKAILVLLIFITVKHGVVGLVWGLAVSNILSLFLTIYLTNRIVHYSLIDLLKDSCPYFLISSVLCFAAWTISLTITNHYLFLGFCISFVSILYLLACYFLKLEASEELFGWIRKKREANNKP